MTVYSFLLYGEVCCSSLKQNFSQLVVEDPPRELLWVTINSPRELCTTLQKSTHPLQISLPHRPGLTSNPTLAYPWFVRGLVSNQHGILIYVPMINELCLFLTFDFKTGSNFVSFSIISISFMIGSTWSSPNTSNMESRASAVTHRSLSWHATPTKNTPISWGAETHTN